MLEASPLAGKTLQQANLPGGVIVGAILRDNQVLLPRSTTEFEAHDRIILYATADAVKKVEQLFAVRLEFF